MRTLIPLALLLLPIAALSAQGIRIVDQEIRYGTKTYDPDDKPRPAPAFPQIHLPITPLPEKITSPGGWQENVYSASGEQTTIQAPGKDWILHLVETTRGVDDTNTGALDYKTWFRVSPDRGKTYAPLKPLVQSGPGYDYLHPIEGVYVGKNGYVFGGRLLLASNGEILSPTYRWPLDENQKPLNPHGAYTYMESGVLIGKWIPPKSQGDFPDVAWESGQFVRPTSEESTRGSDESALAELPTPGHFLMIARGSNQNKPEFPGRKWFSLSKDYCRTWTKPVPWTFTDGTPFYSTASLSSLIRSSKNHKLYWIGNITPENPDGNYPRFPLVIGEVEEPSGLLKRETLLTIDTRNPEHDSAKMQLSNFRTLEDPATGHLLITLTRMDDEKLPPTNDPKTWYQGPPNWHLLSLP